MGRFRASMGGGALKKLYLSKEKKFKNRQREVFLNVLILIKVRPHGQKFSRRTWYMVVRHKTCRGCGSVDGMGDV